MKTSQHHTALLFFSRSEQEECIYKKLSPRRDANINKQLFGALISHSRKVIEQSGLPYFTFTSENQHGNNFGDRFANAIKEVFSKGFTNIITIGNDCPTLSSRDLMEAAVYLKTGRDVVGPATDGGIYLLGIRKKDFDPVSFRNLRWQSANLYSDLKKYFNEKDHDVNVLRVQDDMDNEKDLKALLDQHKNSLTKSIRNILFKKENEKTDTYISPKIISDFHQSLGLRGPPNL